jgi:hypothetical protein
VAGVMVMQAGQEEHGEDAMVMIVAKKIGQAHAARKDREARRPADARHRVVLSWATHSPESRGAHKSTESTRRQGNKETSREAELCSLLGHTLTREPRNTQEHREHARCVVITSLVHRCDRAPHFVPRVGRVHNRLALQMAELQKSGVSE